MSISESTKSTALGERMFVAVSVPVHVREYLTVHTAHLLKAFPFQRIVHPQDYHITLHFLGNISTSQLDHFRETLHEAVRCMPPIHLLLGAPGTFGPETRPSILYVHITGDVSKLIHLAHRVREAADRAGITGDSKPFFPHLTLARRYRGTRSYTPTQAAQIWDASTAEDRVSPNFTVEAITLFASHPGKQPMYEPRAIFPLEGNRPCI